MKVKLIILYLLFFSALFIACTIDTEKSATNNEVVYERTETTELSLAQQYIQIAEQYETAGDKDKAIENYEAALKLIYEAGMFDEGVMYSRKVLSLDSTNEYARYVHEQLLPSGRESYLPGFDEDIDDDHDMELYFSDPYF